MTLFSLIFALLLEQAHPFSAQPSFFLKRYFDWIRQHLTTGESRHCLVAWLIAVIPPLAGVFLTSVVFYKLSPILAWAWNVVVLYVTMGFRQFSGAYTRIERALQDGELQRARELLGNWQGKSVADHDSAQVARGAIEQGMLFSHRYVFGVILWFALFGAAGAVFYRLATVLKDSWGQGEASELAQFAARVHSAIDWLPVRLTAVSFAVVGDFEDALYCWRSQAASWEPHSDGILLAAGAGAIGVRLGEALPDEGYRPALGMGDEADLAYMRSTVGLIWRSLVLWMLLILLFTIASWVG